VRAIDPIDAIGPINSRIDPIDPIESGRSSPKMIRCVVASLRPTLPTLRRRVVAANFSDVASSRRCGK
jgi:hypothetical protein